MNDIFGAHLTTHILNNYSNNKIKGANTTVQQGIYSVLAMERLDMDRHGHRHRLNAI